MTDIVTILLSGGLSAAVVFLLRNWISERMRASIQHEYDQKLETLKAQLKADSETTIEKVKAELIQSRESIVSVREHDKLVFEKMNAILDEKTFVSICKCISDYSFYELEQRDKMYEFRAFGNHVENQFLNKNLNKKYNLLYQSLHDYLSTVAQHFFSTEGSRYMLYPELKNSSEDADRNTYYGAQEEVLNATNEIVEIYEDFRKEVKEVLYL